MTATMAMDGGDDRRSPGGERYAYREGRHLPVPAQDVGEELERISRGFGLTKPNVVSQSEPPDAVLHKCFTWDDKLAAKLRREDEAGRIIRSVVVVREERVESPCVVVRVPAMVSVSDGDGGKVYLPVAEAMSEEDRARQVIEDALAQLRGWVVRCKSLARLAGLAGDVEQALRGFCEAREGNRKQAG